MADDDDRVYLDNHATTPMDPQVVDAMLPYFTRHFGNPGSVGHSYGDAARKAVEDSRAIIGKLLNVSANEVVFTSGATESNNLAIRGIADRHKDDIGHYLSLSTEHKAVLDPLERLKKLGADVTLLSPLQVPHELAGVLCEDNGSLNEDSLNEGAFGKAIRDDTRLVSVMLANNEIGAIQPIEQLVEVCHDHGVLLHCDATQAIGKIPVDLEQLDVDLLSLSGHKIYGPRGVGALIVRRRRPRIRLDPIMVGGGQELGRRSGTLNVPGIVGLAKAMELCHENHEVEAARITKLRQQLYDGIISRLDGVGLNGPSFEHRLPGNLNLHFSDVDGEALMMNMDRVAVSSGSACTSANPEPSHVLRAIGLSEDVTRSSLRFGIGRFNTAEDIAIAIETVVATVARLRSLR